MKTAVIVNTLINPPHWHKHIGKHDPITQLMEKVESIVGRGNVFILVDKNNIELVAPMAKRYKTIKVLTRISSAVLEKMHYTVKDYEALMYLFVDEPLLDTKTALKLLTLHGEEFAEYTYGEGYPIGVLPEIIDVSIFPRLIELAKKETSEIKRDTIFSLLSKRINSFDIETLFAREDLGILKFELTTSLKRNAIIVSRIVESLGFTPTYEEICAFIKKTPTIIRTVPSYVELEITNEVRTITPYSPVPFLQRSKGFMKLDEYKKIVSSLLEFAESFYLSLSYIGEPLLHPDIQEIIRWTVAHSDIKLIVETDGITFDPAMSEFIRELEATNLYVIFQIDAVDDNTYRKIHNTELKYVERNARYLLTKQVPNVYVQMVRMDMNEDEMIPFHDKWKKEGAGVIIQKYNSYLNILPPLSHADLKPLERMSCWHLQRDLVVFFNGDVPRCKQDIDARFLLGNVLQEPIESIWAKGEPLYLNHWARSYDELCLICDEYYVFNY